MFFVFMIIREVYGAKIFLSLDLAAGSSQERTYRPLLRFATARIPNCETRFFAKAEASTEHLRYAERS